MRRSIIGLGFAVMLATLLLSASPAFATPPTGVLVNPSSGGPGTIISDMNHGKISLYRFLVRAAATTTGATIKSVLIEIQPHNASAGNFVTIGHATHVGSTDAWELMWNETASGIPTGSTDTGQVRALVVDSNGESSFVPNATGQSVTFDTSQQSAAITTPADGANLAFSTSNNSATLAFTASSSVNEIQAFYSTTDAATPPSWQSCGSVLFNPGVTGPSSSTVTCALASGTNPNSVTEVAVVPISNGAVTTGSGDAVRVTGGAVGPNSLVITPNGPTQSSGHCQLFTAELLDNTGLPVTSATIDVNATGPVNATYFATVSGKTSSFFAPVAAPSPTNKFETADTCDQWDNSTAAGGKNAAPDEGGAEEVLNTSVTPETKQITGTTDSHGLFTFAVVTGSTGTTSIEAWNDSGTNTPPATCSSGATPCGTASLTFVTPVATTMQISPTQGKASLGKTATFTATVLDQFQNTMGGVEASFSVTSGPNASKDLDGNPSTPPGYFGFCTTAAAGGQCAMKYTDMAKKNGIDIVTTFLDADGNQMPDPSELQASGRQTWGTPVTPTSLTIQPSTKTTIHPGQSVNIQGQLTSASKSCVAGSKIVLSNAHSALAHFTISPGSVKKLSNGQWTGAYHFTRKPTRTEYDHTSYAGSSSCGASRAPTKGAVQIQVT